MGNYWTPNHWSNQIKWAIIPFSSYGIIHYDLWSIIWGFGPFPVYSILKKLPISYRVKLFQTFAQCAKSKIANSTQSSKLSWKQFAWRQHAICFVYQMSIGEVQSSNWKIGSSVSREVTENWPHWHSWKLSMT